MPRKSRRTPIPESTSVVELPEQTEKTQSTQKVKTGGYIRISSDNPETDSLETQLLMIQQYAAENPEFELVDTYVDPGYTGTNFDRPEFIRMIEDIKHGKIQCVIVKDLSRFGRNYIETGYFIETVFPQLNARLVAINDRFDSTRESDLRGLRLPIKNMINSMYAMDLSKKFSDSFDLHSRIGDFKIRESTYGYILDRKNNVLLEDPESSGVVKLIYHWYLSGISANRIAQLLNLAEVEIPCQVKYRLDNKVPRNRYGEWGTAMVSRILKLPTYTGDSVFGRSRRRMYTKEHIRRTKREEWIVHPGTHVALISYSDYEKAQALMQKNGGRPTSNSEKNEKTNERLTNSFCRKVKCAECGNTMMYDRVVLGKKGNAYAFGEYVCKHERLNACGKKISEDLLKMLVFDHIKVLIKLVCDQKQMAKDLLKGTNKKGTMLSLEKKKDYLRKKLPETEEILTKLYMDFTEGIVREDEYKAFRNHYLSEKEELLGRLKELEEEEGTIRAKIRRFSELAEHFESYVDSAEFDQTVIDDLIDCVYLGKNNEIEIRFKCEDVIADFRKTIEETEGTEDAG